MLKAYMLIKFEPNADLAQAKHALGSPNILAIDTVMGPYDSISVIEGKDLTEIAEIAKKIRRCPGIASSITCPVVG